MSSDIPIPSLPSKSSWARGNTSRFTHVRLTPQFPNDSILDVICQIPALQNLGSQFRSPGSGRDDNRQRKQFPLAFPAVNS
jgi:hypothetical protein